MGTVITLYHHTKAKQVVRELNELQRLPPGTGVSYWPPDIHEIEFRSKKHPDIYPLVIKVHRLNAFLSDRGFPTLDAIFGYASSDPEDLYSIPIWEESLQTIRKVLGMFPGIPNLGITIKEYQLHLEAFEEMIFWVINQRDRDSYFLHWSA